VGAPPVRYVRANDGIDLAYQVAGEGPDLLFVPGFPSHLDMWWEPWGGGFVPALAEFCRVTIFDKRGMGLSDRPPNIGIERWLDDIELIRDAAGAIRPIVFGMSAGGPVAAVHTARHPDEVAGLILYGTRAKFTRADDYPYGVSPARLDAVLDALEQKWGTGEFFGQTAPSAAGNPWLRSEYARYERLAVSPASCIAFVRTVFSMNVREALTHVDVPTLVLHATGDRTDPIDQARYMASLLPGATMVELDSDDHLIWLSNAREVLIAAVRRFVGELGGG
jgi:pimeloyl-ACP methyl ester carboxylesterase